MWKLTSCWASIGSMKLFSLLVLVLSFSAVHAEIYKWVDSEGNVHYGDQPDTAAARPMKNLPGLSTYAPPVVPEQEEPLSREGADVTTAPGRPAPTEGGVQEYRSISIVSPEEGGTVRSSPGTVQLFIALAPVLRQGDYLKVILDGKSLKEKYRGTVISLQNIDRGEHKVAVAVYNKKGRKLLQSDTRSFFLHRTIAKPRRAPR